MRDALTTPALVAAHVAVIALACSELTAHRELSPEVAARATAPGDSLSVAELSELDRQKEELMLTIQANDRDLDALAELAHLYMRHGWFAEAIGPLARAVEVDSARDDLFYELLLAVKLSGRAEGEVDFAQQARDFLEAVQMQGHGC